MICSTKPLSLSHFLFCFSVMGPKETKRAWLNKMIKEFKSEFTTDGEVLFCYHCNETLRCDKKSQITQHRSTKKHSTAVRDSTNSQSLLTNSLKESEAKKRRTDDYSVDLCHALVDADIAFHKVKNPTFSAFLEKYSGHKTPDESTLRKNHLPRLYDETLHRIRASLQDSKIWIAVDETTDSESRYIANVIVGDLRGDTPGAVYLLSCEQLQKTNNATISQLVLNSLQLLWPDGIKYNDVLLFLSDAAAYMKKAVSNLSAIFPRMIHLTCLAHGLHRIAEKVRDLHPDVDKFISLIKRIFVKANSRKRLFKEIFPDLKLPPNPVITRWGTWVEAVEYHAAHFDAVQTIVRSFDEGDNAAIAQAKTLLQSPSLKEDLIFIASTFSTLPSAIEKLENSGSELVTSLRVVQRVKTVIQSLTGEKGSIVKAKLESVFLNNPGLEKICLIASMISGDESLQLLGDPGQSLPVLNLSPSDLIKFKYAPTTSCDVERSFSRYKAILSDQRRSFTMDNLRRYLVVNCNPVVSTD